MQAKIPMKLQTYSQIADWIRNEGMVPGAFLPAEREIAEKFNTSRMTVRQSLDILEKEGMIRKEKNRRPVILSRSEIPAAKKTIADAGIENKLIGFYTCVPFSDIIDSSSNNLTNIVAAAMKSLEADGYCTAYLNIHGKNLEDEKTWRTIAPSGISGIIMQPHRSVSSNAFLEMINRQKCPVVLIDGYVDGMDTQAHSIDLDNEKGIASVVRYLFSQGHRRLGFLSENIYSVWQRQRLDGFKKTMRDLKADDSSCWFVTDRKFGDSEGDGILRDIREKKITAVVASVDMLALSLKKSAQARGLSIPEDFSITGFDDIREAVAENITTLSHMSRELGERAAAVVKGLIADPESNLIYRERIVPKLMIRNSVSKI
ncbi:MAG TPA: hypothetical protein DCZ94_14520 [Lentisphaeria bacterium]|nr:MAG: hypothetical protein A2X48_09750 [Lentisphaerae bacterium GWF2_49_21]HBC88161.1 hypothetical protein [Lentisphaeria bacterium]